jgi:Sigma-54 interaction domain
MAPHPKTPRADIGLPSPGIVWPTHPLAALARMLPTPYLAGPFAFDVAEWQLIVQGSSALLQGSQRALKAAVSALEPSLRSPHHTASGVRLSLPSNAVGTLFLEHVAECSTEQQHALLEWLDGAPQRVQVIALIERPLFDLVECGGFLSSLYYRLNTIYLDLGSDS